jgi:hypothetical protein
VSANSGSKPSIVPWVALGIVLFAVVVALLIGYWWVTQRIALVP